ncbi:aKG-HExxH-type peptide beta-hydroxylase [Streptomyces sp. NPDC006925]|uniref:aKG-HExxH-type peptide beta-hydroxylase n=1 Tax=Streptomyces sp. NPDC006925 TaxID=3364768 RepID=UPI00368C1FFE
MTANADRNLMWCDRGLRPERAAEIIVVLKARSATGQGSGRRGSGYLLSPGKVLTAAHVVDGAGSVQVRFQADRPDERTVSAEVAWKHPDIDVAILAVPVVPGDSRDGAPSVSFGRVGERNAELHFTTLGFPRFKLRAGTHGSYFRDMEHAHATCAVLANRREGTFDLKIASPPGDDPDPARDAWEGMSGAAVFCGGHLVGVVTLQHRTDGRGRIAASRVDRWADALSAADLTALERAVGQKLAPSQLPDSSRLASNGAPSVDFTSLDRIDAPLGYSPAVPLAIPQRRVARDRLRGRDELVTALTDALARRAEGDAGVPGVWLLFGMGGCGKTTVALETAHQLGGAAMQVWWVSGENSEALFAALRSVAFAAGAQAADFVGSHPAEVLWTHLNALTTPWLLILDNVDDPTILADVSFGTAALAAVQRGLADGVGWLREPAHPWGTVLATSRESRGERWGRWVHMVGVDLLSADDGAKVLRDLSPLAGSVHEARELAKHLGGLPLSLNLAGSYLARARQDPWPAPSTPMTFTEYRRRLDADLADMASDPDRDLGPVERSRRAILSTWELSLDLLHYQGTDLARPLLRLLTVLGPAPIPYQELIDPELLAGSGLFTDAARPRLSEAVTGLAGLQLITIELTRDPADEGPQRWITIHPMVRAAGRAQADFTPQQPLLLHLVTALLQRFTKTLEVDNPQHWRLWRAIAPHCAAPLELLPRDADSNVDHLDTRLAAEATESAVQAAQFHASLGMYGEAVAELDRLVAVRARLLGDEAAATIATRLHLAWAVGEQGDLLRADQLYQDVARACGRAFPEGHPYAQSARTGRGQVLREMGRFEAAEAELREALAMRRRDPDASARSVLRIRDDLATLAYKRGRYDESVSELRDIAQQNRTLLGSDLDLEALDTEISLARALREVGHTQEAENIAESTVSKYLTLVDPDHPGVLLARHERARLIRDHESNPAYLNRARDEFSEIWQISEDRFGPNHPYAIAARHELATVWHLLGQLEQAEEHYTAVLETGSRQLGSHHPDLVRCADNLARVRAELAERESSSSEEPDLDGPDGARKPLEGIPMDNRPAACDWAELTLENALSPGPPSSDDPEIARILARYMQPRSTRSSGTESGNGGFSTSSHAPTGGKPSFVPPSAQLPTAPDHSNEFTLDSPGVGDTRMLATGEEDRALVVRLRTQQRGARTLALGELLRLVDVVATDRVDDKPMASEVRAILLRAEQVASAAVSTVILHPSVGRWLSRALRALHTPPGGPRTWSGTPSADLRHLHSVVAAAAIRARIGFHLPLPVRDGYVFLPTLGAVDFRPAGDATTAHVVATADSTLVTCGDTGVRLPDQGDPSPARWIPVNRVRTLDGKARFDVILDDMDPYRETDDPMPPRALPPADVTHWLRTFRDTGELLANVVPRQAEALAAALTALTPRPASSSGTVHSASSSNAFGGVVISAPPDAVELAVTLVHEFRHMKLHALQDSLKLHDNEAERPEEELFYAPWRDDPRPLPGFFHGVFAFFGVVDFWQRLAHQAEDARLRRRAQFQWMYWRTQTRDAYRALCLAQRLTADGRKFTAAMGSSTIHTWDHHAGVPEDVAALAMDAVFTHRARWRLHHLRPDSVAIAKLCEEWMSGASSASRHDIVGVLDPDTAVPPLDDYTTLMCQLATDPSLMHRARPRSDKQKRGPVDPIPLLVKATSAYRLAADQVARRPQQADLWARLGLALRANVRASVNDPDSVAATRSLAHRPEVVRALHIRVAAATGTPPDPVALAAWLGDPSNPTESAELPPVRWS